MLSDDQYVGPRRDELGRIDREISRHTFKMDMSMDTADYIAATAALGKIKELRIERENVEKMHVLQLPGVQAWLDADDG
jgi:hypothetical protein